MNREDIKMKKINWLIITVIMAFAAKGAMAQTSWDFTTLSNADATLLANDNTGNWTKNSDGRWLYLNSLDKQPLVASGHELTYAEGLLFSCNASESGAIRIDPPKKRMWVGGTSTPITIPGLKRGQTVTISFMTSSNTTERTITPTNLTGTSGFSMTTGSQTGTGTVEEDGDVVLTPTGALYVYSIEVSAEPDGSAVIIPGANAQLLEDVVANNVMRNSKNNQMYVETTKGDINYYNTADLSAVDVDPDHYSVTITPKAGENDVYYGSVRNISFAKGVSQGDNGDIVNGGVVITEAKGWNESAYVKWEPYSGATSYVVYVKGGQFDAYTKIDNMLVRDYGSYGRADMVGLKADTNYALKVVPVINDAEDESKASYAQNIKVVNYSRDGFAHKTWTNGVGAYNNDGTLKNGARVFYVTKNTAKNITCDVVTEDNGGKTSCKGMQAIIAAYEKGRDTTPITFRIIGKLSAEDMDYFGSSAEGLQIKGRKADSEINMTIEGIGEDATIHGFGMNIRNCKSIELRNFAVMYFMVDGISLDTNNSNIWIHNIDIFYGQKGSAADQVKGDGSIDIKTNSKYVTVDNCHFWDSGKASLCGMKSESGPNYITYHHNWFDHSDSRHARVRTMSVHIWNNYFDGVAKYGAGSTTGSSVFVENNYFRNTNKPMLISMQGTDIAGGKGTFSGENGGIIKSFGNVFAEKSSNFKYVTYQQNGTEFDAWEAASRSDQVPASVKTKQGGTSYDNFDTNASLMYTYTPDAAADVPSIVEGWYGAGRMGHGDFQWSFDNSTEDSNSEIIEELRDAVIAYNTSLKGIFGGETISSGGGNEGGDDPDPDNPDNPDNPDDPDPGTGISADVTCTFEGNAPSSNLFEVNGNYSKDKGEVTINGTTYTTCLKIESKTSVKFTITEPMTMTLVFGPDDTAFNIKVDGVVETGTKTGDYGTLTVDLEAGAHELTKEKPGNLFFIGLTKKSE